MAWFTACHAIWSCCLILTVVCRRPGEVIRRKAARSMPKVVTNTEHYLEVNIAIVAL